MNKLFNESMTTNQLQSVYLRAVIGKSKDEIEELKKNYESAAHVAFEKEMKLADDGWMI